MPSDDLRRKIRGIEMVARKAVHDLMSGRYRSHFKGHGVQFSEHRLYVPGDDVRHINWNVSARTREPLVKKFDEERELSVFLVTDISQSHAFGSSLRLKSECVVDIVALLAHVAIQSGDRVGGLLFAGGIEKKIPLGKGRKHALRMIREVLTFESRTKGTQLRQALEVTERLLKRGGSIIFVISDFLAQDYELVLKRLGKKHDVVALRIMDEQERKLPPAGQLFWRDPETGQQIWTDTSSFAFKKWFEAFISQWDAQWNQSLKGARIETVDIATQEDYVQALVRFFRARIHRS